MRRLICLLVVIAVAVTAVPMQSSANVGSSDGIWRELYVSPNGSDEGEGSASAPFATIERAKQEAREISPDMDGDLVINIAGGRYRITETLDFTVEDSGKNGHNIIYRGENGTRPTLSGGIDVRGFAPWKENPNIYCMSLEGYDGVDMVRSLFMNNRKYRMAQSDYLIKGTADYNDPDTHYTSDGFYVSKEYMTKYENVEDLELFWSREWVDVICKVDEIIDDPQNPDQLIVRMQQSLWQAYKDYPYGGKSPAYDQYFQVINAMELLDRPGEFYYNRKTKMLYVYPFEGTDPEKEMGTIPILERMMMIMGNDVDDCVKNIRFEGLDFAHTTWYAPGRYGYKGHQVQNTWVTNDCAKYMPGTIKLEWADNIHFSNDHFYDHGMSAVDFENAVTNSSCIGNAFNDLDGAAFVEGRREHEEWDAAGGNTMKLLEGGDKWADDKYQNPMTEKMIGFYKQNHTIAATARSVNGDKVNATEDGLVDLMAANERALISTSYYGRNVGRDRDFSSLRVLVNSDVKSGKRSGAWIGDPYAPKKGEKTWVRADFERKYSVDRIVLKFDTNIIPAEYRQKYEILLSNDRDFEDATTVQVAVQDSPADAEMSYDVKLPGQKFRYMMIRTLGATDFGLTTFFVYSKDKKSYTIISRNKGNTFSNNYMQRIAGYIYSSGVVSTDYTEDFSAEHNEIIDTPYTGFELGCGWSWQPFGTTRMNIRNNYIHNVTRYLHDGASIYTLGFMPYSYIVENYIDRDVTGNGALYPDMGTSFVLWKNNVVEDTGVYAAHFWIKNLTYDILENTYSDTNMYLNVGDITCKLDKPKMFLPGTMQPEAYKIKLNAGLEPEYEYLRDLVDPGELRLPDEYQCYLSAASMGRVYYIAESKTVTAENMLKNGNFGNLPWDYDYEYKGRLEEAVYDVKHREDKNDMITVVELRDMIQEAKKTVEHPTLLEMEKMIGEKLAEKHTLYKGKHDATEGAFSEAAHSSLEKALAALKAAENMAEYEQYAEVLKAERAYSDYVNSEIAENIEYINVAEALDVRIDAENKTVTAVMPDNISIENVAIEVYPNATSEWTDVVKNVNLEKPVAVSIYNPLTDRYAQWTLKAVRNDTETSAFVTCEGWTTDAKETEKIYGNADGSLHLDRNSRPYMNTIPMSKSEPTTIKMKPVRVNEIGSFGLIFGLNRTAGFTGYGKRESDNHYLLSVKGNKGELYFIKNGKKELLSMTDNMNVNYNEFNDVKLFTEKNGADYKVSVSVNGRTVISSAANIGNVGGYIGFEIPSIGMDIMAAGTVQ